MKTYRVQIHLGETYWFAELCVDADSPEAAVAAAQQMLNELELYNTDYRLEQIQMTANPPVEIA